MDYSALTSTNYYNRAQQSIQAKRRPRPRVPFGYRGIGFFGMFFVVLVLGGTWLSRSVVVGAVALTWLIVSFQRKNELAMRRRLIRAFSEQNGLQYREVETYTPGETSLGSALSMDARLVPYRKRTIVYSDELSGQIVGRKFTYLFCKIADEVVNRDQHFQSYLVALHVDVGSTLPTFLLATKRRNTVFGSQGIVGDLVQNNFLGARLPESYNLHMPKQASTTAIGEVVTPRVAELLATDGTCDVLFHNKSLVIFIPVAYPRHYVAALPQMLSLAENLVTEVLRENR